MAKFRAVVDDCDVCVGVLNSIILYREIQKGHLLSLCDVKKSCNVMLVYQQDVLHCFIMILFLVLGQIVKNK